MKKNFTNHLLAVCLAGVLSYGMYLALVAVPDADLSADILGIQRGEVTASDLTITQSDDSVIVTSRRSLPSLESMHFVVLFDGKAIDAADMEATSSYSLAQSFEDDQWSVIVLFGDEVLLADTLIMKIQWFDDEEDMVIADIIATFSDGDTERLIFSQTY